MICEKCDYEWTPKVEQPKSCPRCKRRFDYPGKISTTKIEVEKNGWMPKKK
ncbi:hypothetical protein KY341_01200 [Candidatus Woesearchaeota archaeon]|nr:hypothetical protein [Candidatus Woesearchaeota archaeon]